MKTVPTCHPDRPHKAHGLCLECYVRSDNRKAANRKWAATNGNGRRSILKHRYNLTPEQYDQLFKAQKGVCAICKQPPRGKSKLCIDHDHKTGRVRGLLCITCNRHLGWHENTEWREAADKYLQGACLFWALNDFIKEQNG